MALIITIISKRNGFRRCGVAHSDKPTDWCQDDFTDEQWEELAGEPQLILAIKETDLSLAPELPHELTSSAALPQAPVAPQAALPQAPETVITPVADPLADAPVRPQGSEQPGAASPPGEHQGNAALLTGQGQQQDQDQDQDDADSEHQQQEQQPVAKPEKTRAPKARGADK